ncbi:unnamed protein product [Gongylonema pulchrum]|uniref:G domain-containing protein n=1 Tax=Gongylonema pulchrum TaxID=637853 RepID=A0A183DSW2_9BILA|nr:unnamed protein product [Gongylonema pulchrum]
MYDPRLPPRSRRTMSLRELEGPVVGLSLFSNVPGQSSEGVLRLVAGARNGEVHLWEPRMFKEPVASFNACDATKGRKLTCMEVHTHGQVAVIGPPNVGKSLLTNRLIKAGVAAVSCQMDTTQRNQTAILTEGTTQLVLVDSPGTVGIRHAREVVKNPDSRILSGLCLIYSGPFWICLFALALYADFRSLPTILFRIFKCFFCFLFFYYRN